MLYRDDRGTRFWSEIEATGSPPPGLARMLAAGARVYATLGRLDVHGCVAVDGGHIYALCVRCEERGRGVGRALLEHVLRAHGAEPLSLTVFRPAEPDGRRLVEYYARYGFRPVGREGQYLRMRRAPTPGADAAGGARQTGTRRT